MADNETNGNVIRNDHGHWGHCGKSEAFVDDLIKVGLFLKEVLTSTEILRLQADSETERYHNIANIADVLEREGADFGKPIRDILESYIRSEILRAAQAY